MKYLVDMQVSGRFKVVVEAGSFDEADDKANDWFEDADFGELEDEKVEYVRSVEEVDEDGN